MSNCKGADTRVQQIFDGEGFDRKHNDADLLQAIQAIHDSIKRRRLIHWMPAHLDEPKNKHKFDKFLKNGGNMDMVKYNCMVVALAKSGAEQHQHNKAFYDLYCHRKQLTETVLVTVLVNHNQKILRRAKKPPPQPKSQESSEEEESGPEYEGSSDESCDPHKAPLLPPTSAARSSPS